MTLDDLEAVRLIDHAAFEDYRRHQNTLPRSLRPRTLDNMLAALQRPCPGIVLETGPGQILGYCFTHLWGSLGWLGTLGVLPRSQGMGLGRAVIAAGLDTLREAGCTTLALETMPESGRNLALYTRLGLDAREMTLLCHGRARIPSLHTSFEVWESGDALHTIGSHLFPGLDPSPAARWVIDERAGATLVWHEDGAPSAFAILRGSPRREDTLQSHFTIEAAGCLPSAAEHWPRYLGEMQVFARSQGKVGLMLPVNTRQIDLLRATLEAGFQIIHTRVRMVSGASLGAPDAILMLTLAM
jgi:GNAT superfamily N-acetyltransferase